MRGRCFQSLQVPVDAIVVAVEVIGIDANGSPEVLLGLQMWKPEIQRAGPVTGETAILTNNPEFSRLSVPVTGMILVK
jgi:hypothetical protein